MSRHPAFANSSIVQNAATASRLIVTGSSYVASAISDGATSFTRHTKPNPRPMTFSPATQARVRKLNALTHGAVALSAKTVGSVGRVAQNLGATLARRGDPTSPASGPTAPARPGVLNKSMIAFSTIADGIEQSAKTILASGQGAAFTVVGHRYGAQAGALAGDVAGGLRNVGLVYVDAAGVSRKAVLKSVAKGMVVGRMPNGRTLVVGDADAAGVAGLGSAEPPRGSAATATQGRETQDAAAGRGRGSGHGKADGDGDARNDAVAEPPAYASTAGGAEEYYAREKR